MNTTNSPMVKTTIVTAATGEITEYRLEVAATTTGDPAEIAAAITASLEMLRQSIAAQIAVAAPQSAAADDPPPGYAPAEPPSGSPLTPNEAERRFFARYGEIVGGQEWDAVNRYLHRRSAKPTTTEGWIAAAEAVRDRSRGEAGHRPEVRPRPTPARRAYAPD